MIARYVKIVSILFFVVMAFPSLMRAQETKEAPKTSPVFMPTQELVKSKAARFFVTRKFEEALSEFKLLETKYPKDLAIKRYMGACYYHLKKDTQSIAVFKTILDVAPGDIPSHDYLGKIYMRLGEIGKSKEHFSFIVKNDKSGSYVPFAKSQIDTFERLESLKKKVKAEPGQIPPDQFLKTKAAQAFAKADYAQALKEFNELEKQYPKDLTVKRYKGLTQAKLEKFDAAIDTLSKGLTMDPNNVPLHYFVALVLISQRKYAEAKKELEFVDTHDTGSYQMKAKGDIAAINNVLASQKNFSGSASVNAEYNTNPAQRSRKNAAEVPAVKSANVLSLNYKYFTSGAWYAQASYTNANAFHTDSLQQLNYIAHVFGTNLNYVSTLFGNSFFGQFSPSYTYVTVDRHYYSQSYSPSALIFYSLANWWRVLLLEKVTYSVYNNKGSAPDSTSKQGWSEAFTFTNTLFLNSAQTVSTKLTYERGLERPHGATSWKDMNGVGNTLSFPLYFPFISSWIAGWTGDLETKFKYSDYPKYNRAPSTVPLRKDEQYSWSGTINIPLAKDLKTAVKYSYTDVSSKDNAYTYDNIAGGVTLSYTF